MFVLFSSLLFHLVGCRLACRLACRILTASLALLSKAIAHIWIRFSRSGGSQSFGTPYTFQLHNNPNTHTQSNSEIQLDLCLCAVHATRWPIARDEIRSPLTHTHIASGLEVYRGEKGKKRCREIKEQISRGTPKSYPIDKNCAYITHTLTREF